MCDQGLYIIELRHMDVPHFVIEECRHLANNCCTAKCGSTSLSLIILCDVNTIGFVPVSRFECVSGLSLK